MSARAPAQLVEQLNSLGLTYSGQWSRVRRHVQRLACKSTHFDSVWVDALVQGRALSLFQAARINRDQAASLRVGPFVLCEPLSQFGKFLSYRAREAATHREYRVLLYSLGEPEASAAAARLELVVRQFERISHFGLAAIEYSGNFEGNVWGAHRAIPGETADDWVARRGRIPPSAVLATARQMIDTLERLESHGLIHGDVSARELVLTADGNAVLCAPGFRTAVRQQEGYAAADLPPEALDSVAPDRISGGKPATAGGDRFALGVLWWKMLSGRSPWPAGDSLTRLRAIEKVRLPNIRFVVPDTPEPLAKAIEACTARCVQQRIDSYRALRELLTVAPIPSRRAVMKSLAPSAESAMSWETLRALWHPNRQTSVGLSALAGCVVALVLFWKTWGIGTPSVTKLPFVPHTHAPGAAAPDPSNVVLVNPSTANAPGARPRARASVIPVDFRQSSSAPWQDRAERAGGALELLLPVAKPIRLATLRLVPGQVVRGTGGGRPILEVPPQGITIDVEDVRFVDVDFIAGKPPADGQLASERGKTARLVHLRAYRASFDRCVFASSHRGVTAIEWDTRHLSDQDAIELANGQIEIKECVFTDVAIGVQCRSAAALNLLVDGTLHLGPGPLVQFTRLPRIDEPATVRLRHVTLRDASSLAEIHADRVATDSGRISFDADQCVLALRAGGSLLYFISTDDPAPLLPTVEWKGEGSVMTPQGGMAAWLAKDGKRAAMDLARLKTAGLVQSEIGFAGGSREGPQGSQAMRWQVPLRSPDPPGIDGTRLPPLRFK